MSKYLAYLAFMLLSQAASACGCSKPHSPADVRYHAHIFEGLVTSVSESYDQGVLVQAVTFKVRKLIAGPTVEVVSVSFGGSTSCDLEKPNFVVGQTWLISDSDVYLAKDNVGVKDASKLVPSGTYEGNYCSLRELLDTGATGGGI